MSLISNGGAPQTYIVAQSPAVLAQLMRENESRSVNPSAYTTPASVFNTLAVDFIEPTETTPGSVPTSASTQTINNDEPSVKILPIPAHSLLDLDPPANIPLEEPAQIELPPLPITESVVSKMISNFNSGNYVSKNELKLMKQNVSNEELPIKDLSIKYPESHMNKVRSLERNTHLQGFSTNTPVSNERYPMRINSLERSTKLHNSVDEYSHNLLHYPIISSEKVKRQFSLNSPSFSRVFSNDSLSKPLLEHISPRISPKIREMQSIYSGSPKVMSQPKMGIGMAKMYGNSTVYSQQIKEHHHTGHVQEDIYDFGGANVKSCANINNKMTNNSLSTNTMNAPFHTTQYNSAEQV